MIVVVDGQGGGLGRTIIQAIKKNFPELEIIGVGTNSTATANLKKGGADLIATGENAIIYNVSHCDLVIGPIGIILANAMYGEISPRMAEAISSSPAMKYLIPMSQSNVRIVGSHEKTIAEYIDDLIELLKKRIHEVAK